MLSSTSIVIMLCGITIAAFSQILLKTSANNSHKGFLKQYMNWRVILGYSMLMLSTLLSVLAYAGMDYKYGPAMESIGFVLVGTLSCLVLKEKMSRKKVIGYALIVVGLIVFCQ